MQKTFLPPEILTEIFQYVEDDYKTLFSCVLVNKYWHKFSIPKLWRHPFISTGSNQILVNCLLGTKDKDFLKKNNIKLSFELLKSVII